VTLVGHRALCDDRRRGKWFSVLSSRSVGGRGPRFFGLRAYLVGHEEGPSHILRSAEYLDMAIMGADDLENGHRPTDCILSN